MTILQKRIDDSPQDAGFFAFFVYMSLEVSNFLDIFSIYRKDSMQDIID